MKIKVIIDKNNTREWDVDPDVTLEELAKKIQPERPYRILLARVGGVDRELVDTVEQAAWGTEDELEIEFLDMTTHSADMTYQRGISMIYLKAVRDVFGKEAVIDNTLNKGFYTKARLGREITDEDVEKIDHRMREIINNDIPIERVYMSKEEGEENLFLY